jgi:hypothetical protein
MVELETEGEKQRHENEEQGVSDRQVYTWWEKASLYYMVTRIRLLVLLVLSV